MAEPHGKVADVEQFVQDIVDKHRYVRRWDDGMYAYETCTCGQWSHPGLPPREAEKAHMKHVLFEVAAADVRRRDV